MSTGRKVFVGFILAVNVLMLIWLISIGNNVNHACDAETQYRDACQAGANIGGGIGVIFVVFIWAALDVILGVIFFVTRGAPKAAAVAGGGWTGVASQTRACPHCAEQIQFEAKVCKHCGRDVEPVERPPIPQWNCQTCGSSPAKPPTKNCLQCGAVMPGWEHSAR